MAIAGTTYTSAAGAGANSYEDSVSREKYIIIGVIILILLLLIVLFIVHVYRRRSRGKGLCGVSAICKHCQEPLEDDEAEKRIQPGGFHCGKRKAWYHRHCIRDIEG